MGKKYYWILLQLALLSGCKSNKTYNFNAEGVYGAFFNERTEYVYAGKGNGELILYDPALKEVDRHPFAAGPVSTCISSPDGKYMVNTTADGRLSIWDVSGNVLKPVWEKQLHRSAAWTCLFSPAQHYVLSTGADSTIIVLRWPELTVKANVRSGSGSIRFGWISHDEEDLLWVTEGGFLVRRNLETQVTDSVLVAPAPLNCVVSDKRKHRMLVAADNGNIYMLDYLSMQAEQVVEAHEGPAYVAEFWDTANTRVSSCGADGYVRTWILDEPGGRYVPDHAVKAHNGVSCTLYYNAAGDKLLSGGQDGWLKIWDAASLELINSVHTGNKK
jgi:WD40 repeat protein